MRPLFCVPALALTLAACAGGGAKDIPVENAPRHRVVCETTTTERAYDTGHAIVAAPTVRRVEILVADKGDINARLEALGVGTRQNPCTRLDIFDLPKP